MTQIEELIEWVEQNTFDIEAQSGEMHHVIDRGEFNEKIKSILSTPQTVTVPPTHRPLKVGDVLVCKDAMSWFTLGKQYIVKSIEDINFINAICLTNDDYSYEWFSVNKDSIDFWQKYFTLKP
jgi:hypothetical protein